MKTEAEMQRRLHARKAWGPQVQEGVGRSFPEPAEEA